MVKTALTLIFCILLASGLALDASAQQPQSRPGTAKSPRPLWWELSPKQQAILAPLAADWDTLDNTRRKKWVAIANRYPKMKPSEQQRLQKRMQAWAALTPAQRRVARENYKALRQLPRPPRGELKQKWEQHQHSFAPQPDSAPDTTTDSPGK